MTPSTVLGHLLDAVPGRILLEGGTFWNDNIMLLFGIETNPGKNLVSN